MSAEPQFPRDLKAGDQIEVTATGCLTIDRVSTPAGTYMQHWLCDPPPWGASFRVTTEHWDDSTDPPIRYIEAIDKVSVSGDWRNA